MTKYSTLKLPSHILLETAEKAKALRKRKKISQAELAERAAVSLGSLRRFEQTGQISYESLLKISLILGQLEDFEQVLKVPEDMDRIERLFEETGKL